MSIFEQLTQAVADQETCWAAFKAAEQQGKDITSAVIAWIAADQAQVDERTATLTTQSQDPARPEVVRRLPRWKLERMQGTRLATTKNKITAFNSAMQDAEAALRDFTVVEDRIRALFGEANQELKTMRSSTLGNGSKDPELATKWLEGVQRNFDRLVREDGGSSV